MPSVYCYCKITLTNSSSRERIEMRMRAIDKLINYILSLTPEQAEEFATIIETLTDTQKEYICQLTKALFCQTAD